MTAIDMNRGEHAWMQPLGNGDRYRNLPLLRDLDLPPLGGDGRGGPLLTRTLLINAQSAGGTGADRGWWRTTSRPVTFWERSICRPAPWERR